MSDEERGTATTHEDSSSGLLSEDWLATIVGLGILALALFGLIPEGLLW